MRSGNPQPVHRPPPPWMCRNRAPDLRENTQPDRFVMNTHEAPNQLNNQQLPLRIEDAPRQSTSEDWITEGENNQTLDAANEPEPKGRFRGFQVRNFWS